MELQVGVKVLLRNPEGKFLLIRRSGEKYSFVKWDIPGGRIDKGSSLHDNLVREVTEETGLSMTSKPRAIAAQDIFPSDKDIHVVRITYVGTTEGDPKLSEEHTEYRWITFAELKALKVEELDRYLKALLEEGAISEAIV